jgi:hypothetical protein
MAIEYKMDASGGFYAADTETKVIEYAYPTSIHAEAARKHPEQVAAQMMNTQLHYDAQWATERWERMWPQMQAAQRSIDHAKYGANNTTNTGPDGLLPALS